jgi:PAS domain S-box-containing protein
MFNPLNSLINASNNSQSSNSQVKVLIVDDSEAHRSLYRRYIRTDISTNYQISEANNIREGLKLWRSLEPDVVVLDFSLPDSNGLEFLEAIGDGAIEPKLPVIMLTAYKDGIMAAKAIKIGAADYLIKDEISFDSFCRSIHQVVDRFKLFRQLERSQQQEILISEISLHVRRSLEQDEIYEAIVHEVKNFLNADRTVIYKFNPNLSGTIVAEAVDQPWIASINANIIDTCFRDNLGGAYRQGRIFAANDIYNANLSACHIQLLERFQVKANLVVPILLPDSSTYLGKALDNTNENSSLWGLLIVHQCSTTRNWEDVDLRLLQQLSVQLAIAIQQAELYQNLQKLNSSLEEKVQKRTIELQDSERKFRAIFNNTFQLTGLISLEGVLLEINQTALDFSGITREKVVNLPFWDLDWWSISEASQTQVKQAIATASQGQAVRYEVDIRGVDENLVTIDFSLRPLKDESGTVILLILEGNDISDRKQNEAKLAAAKVAEASNKAKSEFLATMSHEIRTPMNAVIGMAGMLTNTPLSAKQQQFVSIIRQGGEVLLSVINKILDFSQIESGSIELEEHPFDLHHFIEEILDLMSSSIAEKSLELSALIDLNVPHHIVGDSTCLRQILVNLIGNAIKFTEKGEIAITVSSTLVESDLIASDKYQLEFTVRDTGIGIASDANRLFKPFSQADSSITRQYGGTGLGLVICKQLCKLMGGEIQVKSQVGQGTTFSFFITTQAIATDSTEAVLAIAPELQNKRILVVNTKATIQQIIHLYAESWGMIVQPAYSEVEALQHLERLEFDAILIDRNLQSIDGMELARNILDIFPTLPIILLTPILANEIPIANRLAGHLTKPITSAKLYQAFLNVFSIVPPQPPSPLYTAQLDSDFAIKHPFQILIVEDNSVNQQILLLMLERLGYQGDAVGNGLESVNALERQSYDLIFMDIQMPVMDGLTACKHIRQLAGRNPWIIGLSANAFKESRDTALLAGMNDYLTKPLKIEELISILQRVSLQLQSIKITNAQAESKAMKLAKFGAISKNLEPLTEQLLDPLLANFANTSGNTSGNTERSERSITPSGIYFQSNFSISRFAVINLSTLSMLEQCISRDALSEIIASYLNESEQTIAKMRSSLQELDFAKISFENHSLKGGCGTLGADRLVAICNELSYVCKSTSHASKVKTLDILFQQLELEFVKVAQFLQQRITS